MARLLCTVLGWTACARYTPVDRGVLAPRCARPHFAEPQLSFMAAALVALLADLLPAAPALFAEGCGLSCAYTDAASHPSIPISGDLQRGDLQRIPEQWRCP